MGGFRKVFPGGPEYSDLQILDEVREIFESLASRDLVGVSSTHFQKILTASPKYFSSKTMTKYDYDFIFQQMTKSQKGRKELTLIMFYGALEKVMDRLHGEWGFKEFKEAVEVLKGALVFTF